MNRLKSETTSTEFVMWKKRLEDEPNDFHREDWFVAQLCMEVYLIRKSLTGGKIDRKLEDYILKFTPKTEDKIPEPEGNVVEEMDLTEYQAARDAYSEQAMTEWMTAFGAMVGDQVQPSPPTKGPEKLMGSVPTVPAAPGRVRRKRVRVGRADSTNPPDATNRTEMPLSDENEGEGGASASNRPNARRT